MKLKIIGMTLVLISAVVLFGPLLIPIRFEEGGIDTRDLAQPQSRFIKIFSGNRNHIDVHYLTDDSLKDLNKTAFVLLHGFTFNSFTWTEVFGFFKRQGRVLAYDQIPAGLSEKVVVSDSAEEQMDVYHPEHAVRQLFSLMDRFEMQDAVLVGNSAGAALAVRAALARPDRVKKLILISPAVYIEHHIMPGWIADTPQFAHLGPIMARHMSDNSSFLEKSYYDPSRITDKRRYLTGIHTKVRDWDRAFWNFFRSMLRDYPEIINRFHEIKQPVLVVCGKNDPFLPVKICKQFVGELHDASLFVLPDCGHLPQEECPQHLQNALENWLENI